MPEISNSLNSLIIQSNSPDRKINGEISSWNQIEIWFCDENSYYNYKRDSLEYQVATLLKSLMTIRDEARKKILSQFDGWRSDDVHWDARHRRYRTEIAEVMSEGISGSGRIEIYRVGLFDWMVAIKRGTLEELEEEEFCNEISSALSKLQHDYAVKVYEMKRQHFGL